VSLVRFLAERRAELLALTGQHVVLVLVSTGIAAALGLPLGIAMVRRPRLARPVLAVAGLLQTIPSLALFGFLIPLPFVGGIGARTAIVALVLYALLPILRNTYIGILQVDRAVIEAATGLGMTASQRLRMVELPLALPVILAGVRIAAVVSVGTATIAAAVGAGGLGTYVFRGIATVDTRLILAGAIPAALLALLTDALLGAVEKSPRPARAAAGLAVGAALIAALALVSARPSRQRAVVVGSKNFTEQVLLGELVSALLEDRGFAVDRRLNLGGTNVCHEAVMSGQLDVYVEYTGTALTDILKQPVRSDPAEVLREVRAAYTPLGLRVGRPLGFNNTFALVMRRADAARLRIVRISDLAPHAATLRVGLFGEFLERKDGMAGLLATYGFRFGVRPREMDLGLLYPALAAGQVDLVVGSATDGLIAALDMVVLEDDRHYFPPYDAVPILNEAALARHPGLAAALDALAGRIDEATMRRLNYAVDGEHRAPAAVARELLAGIGLYRDKSATTLTGPPDPPAIFMGRASTQAPASGRELMSPRFSSPGTFARAAIWWTAKSFEGPWSMLAVSTPNAATWRSSTRRRAASAPYDGKCRREASPGVSSPK
jgi:osmoprotectant transport system permease protein